MACPSPFSNKSNDYLCTICNRFRTHQPSSLGYFPAIRGEVSLGPHLNQQRRPYRSIGQSAVDGRYGKFYTDVWDMGPPGWSFHSVTHTLHLRMGLNGGWGRRCWDFSNITAANKNKGARGTGEDGGSDAIHRGEALPALRCWCQRQVTFR